MNTRGLMELVVLNIGYDLGVLSAEVFAMMVIMALVTTMMTGPALDLINRFFKEDDRESLTEKVLDSVKYKVLISFGNPETGRSLLRLADTFTKKQSANVELTTMHLSPASDIHRYNADEYEKESFHPVLDESAALNRKINILFKASDDIESDIAEVANEGHFDLLLIGVGKSIYQGTLLGKILGFTTRIFHPSKFISNVTGRNRSGADSALDDRTTSILSQTNIATGVFIDKGSAKADRIIVIVSDDTDQFLMDYAERFIKNNSAQIFILQLRDQLKSNHIFKERIRRIEQTAPNHISILPRHSLDRSEAEVADLMVISFQTWKHLVYARTKSLADAPSTLILRN